MDQTVQHRTVQEIIKDWPKEPRKSAKRLVDPLTKESDTPTLA